MTGAGLLTGRRTGEAEPVQANQPADRRSGRVPAVELDGLRFGFQRRPPILDSVSLTVEPGQLTMILGASGSGKTTLLKLIKGLLRPQAGEIRLLGATLPPGRANGRLDQRIAYIPQQLGLVRSRTVLDNTLAGALGDVPTWRGLLGLFPRDLVQLAMETLAKLGIDHKAVDRVRTLSGGERQRVAIARALLQRPRLLLADEFVSQLDPATTAEIMTLVREIAAGGVTVLMTTHELDLVERFADSVVLLRDGVKVLDCPAGQVSTAELATLMKR